MAPVKGRERSDFKRRFHVFLSIVAGFLGVMGLTTAINKKQPGGVYSVVGICVSALACITSIMLLVAISGEGRHWK